MPALVQQAEVLRELSVLSNLRVEADDDAIRLFPGWSAGFSMELRCQRRAALRPMATRLVLRCGNGPLEFAFSSEDDALDLLFHCLTEDVRLIVETLGGREVAWDLQQRAHPPQSTSTAEQPDSWQSLGRARLWLVPFWKTREVRVCQNPYIRPPQPVPGQHGSDRGGGSP